MLGGHKIFLPKSVLKNKMTTEIITFFSYKVSAVFLFWCTSKHILLLYVPG